MSKVLVEMLNQKGETAANWRTNQLVRRRHPGPAPVSPGPKRERKAIASVWDEPGTASPLRPDFLLRGSPDRRADDMGAHTFGKDEIIAFARQFDPQPFHLDEVAAKASLFGALCASGWHTAAYCIRGNIPRASQATIRLARRAHALPPMAPRRVPRPCLVQAGVRRRHAGVSRPASPRRSTSSRAPIAASSPQTFQARNQKGEIVFAVTTQILAERHEALSAERYSAIEITPMRA
jgi:hypothetical protein